MSRLDHFADDRRGRVPFAVVAALLLVSSATFAASLPLREVVRPDRTVDEALDRVGTTTRPLLRAAVADAAREAAGAPVITPGESATGRALAADGDPFRDALRLRIYLHARHRLEAAAYASHGVRATASLPAVSDPTEVRAAIERVGIESIDGGRSIRVRFRNVSLRVRDGERALARATETYIVTVATPVLTMHERTEDFQRRLRAGPLDGAGLGRQLTARLYPVAWARGGLQYAGAPIQNVVTNRHVALATNGGVLASQRAAFGTAAPTTKRAYGRAVVQTGATDIFALTPPRDGELLRSVVPDDPLRPSARPLEAADRSPTPPASALGPEAPSPDDGLTVGVNRSADEAALVLVTDDSVLTSADDPDLTALLADEYRVDATLTTRVDQTLDERPSRRPPAGSGWHHVAREVTTETTVANATAPLPAAAGRVVAVGGRRVTIEHVATHTWRRGNETQRTTDRWRAAYRVGFVVTLDTDAHSIAPSKPVVPAFTTGGVVEGPNFRAVPAQARARLLGHRGGPDAIAERAVRDGVVTSETTISVARPAALRPWVEADLVTFSRRVRTVSVTVPRGDVASGRANPAATLLREFRSRRGDLLATPKRYDGVADRARTAARSAYLDAVDRRLAWRAEQHRRASARLNDVLMSRGIGSASEAGDTMDTRDAAHVADSSRVSRSAVDDELTLVPDPAPAYLTLSAVPRGPGASRDAPAYHPLVAHNTNVFTIPYGDAVDTIVDGDTTHRVDLGTAGRVLLATEHALEREPTPTHRARRDALRVAITRSLDSVESRATETLNRHSPLAASQSILAVEAVAERWSDPGSRAVAVTNGSFAAALAHEVALRGDLDDTAERKLRLRLRVVLGRLVAGDAPETAMAHVPVGPVQAASNDTRSALRAELKAELKARGGNLTSAAARRAFGDRFRGVPAGLPLLPIPGYWVATINVWHVEVRGEYARFILRSRDGDPRSSTAYVRDGSAVELDIDGDGTPERLGWSDRVTFETETVVLIAVPPSGRGVGDIDGNAHEPSPGWPCPGSEAAPRSCLGALAT